MLGTFNQHFSTRLDRIDLEPQIQLAIESQRVKLAAIEIPRGVDTRLREEITQAIDDSFVAGFRLVMIVASGLAILSSATAKFMIEDKQRGTQRNG